VTSRALSPGKEVATRCRGPDLDQLRIAYGEIGDAADRFLVGLERAQPRSAAYHARRILALREGYQTDDVVAAMDHALQCGTFEHHAIERILASRAAPRRLDEYIYRPVRSCLGPANGEVIWSTCHPSGPDHVVPVAVEAIRFDRDRLEFLVRDRLTSGVLPSVDTSANHETTAIGSVRDQADHGLVGA